MPLYLIEGKLEKNMALYGITISCKNRDTAPDSLYLKDKGIVMKWLNRFSDHYIIVPEFTDNGRLHYHGTVKINDLVKFYRSKYRIDKELGFVKIDKLIGFKNHLTWTIYIYKNYGIIKDVYSLFMYKKIKRKRSNKDILIMDTLKKQNRLNIIAYFEYLQYKEWKSSEQESRQTI